MSETLITWNVPNWLTVLLMVAVGLSLVSVASQVYHNKMAA